MADIMKPEIICVGPAVLDIVARPVGNHAQWKEKQRIDSIRMFLGGDAANQCVHLSDMGHSVEIAACIGADQNGVFVRNLLEQRGVDTTHLAVRKDLSTGTSLVLVDELGERHIFSAAGAHGQLSAEDCAWILEKEPRALSIASFYIMPELEERGMLELLQNARKRGTLTFADMGSDKKNQKLSGVLKFLPYLDYFLPSLYEAAEMTGKETAEEAAEIFLEKGVSCAVIKCGAEGCYYVSEKARGWISAMPVKPVDTTGAGDCMASFFISRILKGDTKEQALRFACRGASLSTLYQGASAEILTEEQIRKWRI